MRTLPIASALLWALGLQACRYADGSAPGERRAAADRCAASPSAASCAAGGCPSGERCSSLTPNGLVFSGATLGFAFPDLETPLEPTAVGGVQRLEVDGLPFVMSSSTAPGFTVALEGSALELVDVALPIITVRGLNDGTALLRVLYGTSLLDRISIEASVLDRAELLVPDALGLVGRPPETAVLARSTVPLVVALFDDQDRRLVDQAVTTESATVARGLSVTGAGWDLVPFHTELSGPFLAKVFSGGQTFFSVVRSVDSVDQIKTEYGDDARVHRSSGWTGADYPTEPICFRAWAEDRVVSVPAWRFQAPPDVTLLPTVTVGTTGCVVLRSRRAQTIQLSILAGGAQRSASVRFE